MLTVETHDLSMYSRCLLLVALVAVVWLGLVASTPVLLPRDDVKAVTVVANQETAASRFEDYAVRLTALFHFW